MARIIENINFLDRSALQILSIIAISISRWVCVYVILFNFRQICDFVYSHVLIVNISVTLSLCLCVCYFRDHRSYFRNN